MIDQNQLKTFREVRQSSSSYTEALDRYAKSLASYYSLEKAKTDSIGEISVARWITFQTEGIGFSNRNLALLLVGQISFQEKINLHPFQTFHASAADGQFGRNLLSALAEVAGLLLGIAGITFVIAGMVCLFSKAADFSAYFKIGGIITGLFVLFVSRLVLRFSKMLKIPAEILKDPTSPFRLHSLRKIDLRNA